MINMMNELVLMSYFIGFLLMVQVAISSVRLGLSIYSVWMNAKLRREHEARKYQNGKKI